MRALLIVLLALPAYVAVAQQRPALGGPDAPVIVVRGQVRSDDASATFLRRARVSVAGSSGPVFTDQDGRFEIAVPAGTSPVLRITKPGFAPVHVPLTAVVADPIQVRLARGAAIFGRVLDEGGSPVAGVDVRVRRLVEAERGAAPINSVIETDDLGEFRVGSLPAGTYEASVERSAARVTGIGPGGNQMSEAVILNPARAGAALDASSLQKLAFRLRAGEETEAALFYEFREAEARAATSYVAGYEAAQREAETAAMRRASFNRIIRGTATVIGRVTGQNGRGVAGAIVRLNPATAGVARISATDAQGRFVIAGIVPGAYRVVATKTGLVPGEFGQDSAAQPGKIVTLRDRQRLESVDIGMWRGSVVTGTVTDADGEPLEGLAMHVWRLRFWNGRRISEAAAEVSVRRSDDRGHYRIHGLQPGTYYVVASDDPSASSRTVNGAPRSYYPGTPMIGEASTVRVEVGVDADTHITFNTARTFRLAGRAVDSENNLLERPLVLAGSTRAGVATAPQTAAMNGEYFAFEHVVPGSYVIHAIQHRESSTGPVQEFAMQFLDVTDYDNMGLQVITAKGATVAGRIVVEGDLTPGVGTPFPFDIVSADPDFAPPPGQFRPWTVRFIAGGFFQADGLSGPIRFTSPSAPAGWFLKSVDIGGRNAAEEPVTFGTPNDWRGQVNVVFSSAGAEISGRVVNGRNEPVGTYAVVAFPVDRKRWYTGSSFIKAAHPGEEARFALATLPPGDYFVAAVDVLPEGSLEDPELLERLSTIGRRVALSAGQRLMTDLPLARFSR